MSWIKFQEEVEGKKKVEKEEEKKEEAETKSNSLPSPDIMHSQVPSGGTPTRLPIHPTLIPATMQVGSNGERHLILHYPDGHSVATTALPNQSGQFHLVPMLNQPQVQSSQTALRLIQTAADFPHTNRQPLGMHVETHAPPVKKKSGQKVELVCTCPPELHNGELLQHFSRFFQFVFFFPLKFGLFASNALWSTSCCSIWESFCRFFEALSYSKR